MIGEISGQHPGSRWAVRFFAKGPAGENEFERVVRLTSLGVKRLRERLVGTADVVIRRQEAKQMIENGDSIEDLKVEAEVESQVCQN